jgi:hypothetical protein
MKCITSIALLVAFSVCSSVCVPVALLAADAATLDVVDAKPPDGVSEPIRAALDGKVLRLSMGGKPFYEFWFRKALPLAEKPANGTLGLATMQEGTVLGVVRVSAEQFDFRSEEIPPGVYVMRFGLQPEDGNHLGVAPTRTFALLVPIKQDTKLEPIGHKELMKAAATINAAKHPSNLNLQPTEKLDGKFPRLEELSGGEHKVVVVKFPARVGESQEQVTLIFAIVYDGAGQA